MKKARFIIGLQIVFLALMVALSATAVNSTITVNTDTDATIMRKLQEAGLQVEYSPEAVHMLGADTALVAEVIALASGKATAENVEPFDGGIVATILGSSKVKHISIVILDAAPTTELSGVTHLPGLSNQADKWVGVLTKEPVDGKASSAGQVTLGETAQWLQDIWGVYNKTTNLGGILTQTRDGVTAVYWPIHGRLMALAATENDVSPFWINWALIKREKAEGFIDPIFHNVGGIRVWTGVEGGPGSVFHAQGAVVQNKDVWRAQTVNNAAHFEAVLEEGYIFLETNGRLITTAGHVYDIKLSATHAPVAANQVASTIGLQTLPADIASGVGVVSKYVVTNQGAHPTTDLPLWAFANVIARDTGVTVVPVIEGTTIEKVVTDYFNPVKDRIAVSSDGFVAFRTDGNYETKFGVDPTQISTFDNKTAILNYSTTEDTIFVVALQYSIPEGATPDSYANYHWDPTQNPRGGEPIAAYNNQSELGEGGRTTELEVISPAKELKPGESTFMSVAMLVFTAPNTAKGKVAISEITEALVGASADQIEKALPKTSKTSSAGFQRDTSVSVPEGTITPFTIATQQALFTEANSIFGQILQQIDAVAKTDAILDQRAVGQLKQQLQEARMAYESIRGGLEDDSSNIVQATNRNIQLLEHTLAEVSDLVQYGQQLQALEGVEGYESKPVIPQYKDTIVPILLDINSPLGRQYNTVARGVRNQLDTEIGTRQGCKIELVDAADVAATQAILTKYGIETAVGISDGEFANTNIGTYKCQLDENYTTALPVITMRAKGLSYLLALGDKTPEPLRALVEQMFSSVMPRGVDVRQALRDFVTNGVIHVLPGVTVYYEEGELEQLYMQSILTLEAA